MKKSIRTLSALACATAIVFSSCKKDNTPTPDPNPELEVKTHSEDQNRVSADLDEVTTEANFALESVPSFSGRVQNTNSLCGITSAVDTSSATWKIILTYNGNNCAGTHLRTGTVVLSTQPQTRWKDAGAVVTVTFQNLKVKRLSDNKSITLNGAQAFTNVSGGLLFQLPNRQSITHTTTSSNMAITFDDNTQRTWNIARKRVFTLSANNKLVMTVHGIGTNGNVTNAAEWGVNRFAHPFTTSITQPLVVREDCNFRLTEGEIKHQGFATATATFGLNAAGAPTSCPGANPYYYKLVWTGPNGNSVSAVLPY